MAFNTVEVHSTFSRCYSLTYNVPFCEFKGLEGVQTGKGDQVERLVHGVVHTHHTDIPATKETHITSHLVLDIVTVMPCEVVTHSTYLTTLGSKNSSCQDRHRCSERSTTVTQCSWSRDTCSNIQHIVYISILPQWFT